MRVTSEVTVNGLLLTYQNYHSLLVEYRYFCQIFPVVYGTGLRLKRKP